MNLNHLVEIMCENENRSGKYCDSGNGFGYMCGFGGYQNELECEITSLGI